MNEFHPSPPKRFLRFFHWFCHPKLLKYIEGDLMELYDERLKESKKRKADAKFIIDVLLLFRPGIIRPVDGHKNLNHYGMYKSYFKVGWRNLFREKGYSLINIGGLALGMTVAILIGLWVYDELSFNKYHKNYDSIAQVYSGEANPETGIIGVRESQWFPLGAALRSHYKQYLKHVLMAWWPGDCTLSDDDKKLTRHGQFIEPGAPEMLSLKMLNGNVISLSASSLNQFSESESNARE